MWKKFTSFSRRCRWEERMGNLERRKRWARYCTYCTSPSTICKKGLAKVVGEWKKKGVERKGEGSERCSRIRESAEVGLVEVTHMLQPCTSVPTYEYKASQAPGPITIFLFWPICDFAAGKESCVA